VYANTVLRSVPLKVSLHKCSRRQVTKPCLPPLAIVKQVNIFGDFTPDLLPCRVTPKLDQLILERPQKLSIGALSKQFPRRLMDARMPNCATSARYSCEQYWQDFLKAHNLQASMSRRGNCWDTALAESFFGSLKKERIRKGIYKARDLARADIFDYIEVFYNRTRPRPRQPRGV
jgi:hypothetical protein